MACLDGIRYQANNTQTVTMQYLLLLVLIGASYADYTGHRLISIDARTKHDLDILDSLSDNPMFEGLDFWTDLSLYQPVEVRVTPDDYRKLQGILQDVGIAFKVRNENVQAMIDNERKAMAKAPKSSACDIYSTFCTFEKIVEWLETKASDNPDNMQLSVMNTNSWEGRSIYQVKIAKDMSNPKPAVWIEAGTHAREWISVSSALVLIDKLLDSSNSNASVMLSQFDWYIAPVHNPDGYVYTHTTQRLWRKNRQSCNWLYTGTDLNRNWDSNFGGTGSSGNCGSDTYRGTSAFSAPETAALRDAVEQTDNVMAFFSIHCYSQFMLLPYGFTSTKPGKYSELFRVAEEMMKALEAVDGRYFLTGTPPDILYAASGGAYDYFYLQGIPYAYTYELRPQSGTSNGFVLDPAEITSGTAEVFFSLYAFAADKDLDFTSEFSK